MPAKSPNLRLREDPAGFGLKNSNQRAGLDASFVFNAFIRRELTLVALVRQFLHAPLCAFESAHGM